MLFQITRNKEGNSKHVIFYLDGDAVSKFRNAGITIQKLPGKKSILSVPAQVYTIAKYCLKNSIALINAHHRYFDVIGRVVATVLRLPLVTCVQSKVYSREKLSYQADIFIAPGETIKHHLQTQFKVDGKKIKVINNFVVPEDYQMLSAEKIHYFRESNAIPENKKIVLFMGRLSKEKGIDVLLATMRTILSENQDVLFLVIGNGEEKQFVESYKEILGDKFRMFPSVAQVAPWYQMADIVVLPSRVDPYPLAVLECGYFTKTLIASAVDGIAEVIVHGESGYLVPPENSTALLEGLTTLLQDPAMCKRLASGLHQRVVQKNLSSHMLPQYEAVYQSMVKNRIGI